MSDNENPSGKHGSPRYALTDGQRKFLETGDPGGYRESVLENDIQEKVDDLGHRIDHLLGDVALLDSNGYLDDDVWGEAWTDFIGFSQSPVAPPTFRTVDEFIDSDREPDTDDLVDACTYGPRSARGRPTSSPTAIGRDLGAFAQQIMLHPVGVDREQVLRDMIWGFVRGAYLDHRPAGGDSLLDEKYVELQEERLDEVISTLQERAAGEVEWVEERHKAHMNRQEESKAWNAVQRDMVTQVREILHDEGLPTEPAYTSERLNEELDEFHEEASEFGINPDLLLGYVIADVVGSEYPPMSAGQWIEFTTEYGPVEEFDPDDVVTRDRVLSAVDEQQLLVKSKLSEYRDRDRSRLEEKSGRGVEPVDIFEQVCTGDRPSSKAIARELGSEMDDQSAVTEVCNDLSGRVDKAGRDWSDRPLVTGSRDGWEPTAYGAYLGRSLFGSAFSIPTSADDQDLSTRAAKEIDVEINWEYSE